MRFEFIARFTMFHEFNNDIMLTQVAVDVVGTINVMGSGDVMSW
jgi:hypothetical protein